MRLARRSWGELLVRPETGRAGIACSRIDSLTGKKTAKNGVWRRAKGERPCTVGRSRPDLAVAAAIGHRKEQPAPSPYSGRDLHHLGRRLRNLAHLPGTCPQAERVIAILA